MKKKIYKQWKFGVLILIFLISVIYLNFISYYPEPHTCNINYSQCIEGEEDSTYSFTGTTGKDLKWQISNSGQESLDFFVNYYLANRSISRAPGCIETRISIPATSTAEDTSPCTDPNIDKIKFNQIVGLKKENITQCENVCGFGTEIIIPNIGGQCTSDEECRCKNFDGDKFIPGTTGGICCTQDKINDPTRWCYDLNVGANKCICIYG